MTEWPRDPSKIDLLGGAANPHARCDITEPHPGHVWLRDDPPVPHAIRSSATIVWCEGR